MGETPRMNPLQPKVVICGDGAIGKTCLLKTLMLPDDAFDENYQPTASNNHRLALEAESGEHGAINIDFELWDTAGQEAWKTLGICGYPSSKHLMRQVKTSHRLQSSWWAASMTCIVSTHTRMMMKRRHPTRTRQQRPRLKRYGRKSALCAPS